VLGWRFFDRFLPIGQAVAGAGTWLAFAVAVAVVTNATCRRSPSHAPAVFLGSVVVLAAPAVIPLIHSAWLPEQCDLGQWIFALLFAALVMAVWGAPGGIATSRRLQLRELAQSIQSSQVSQLAVDQEVLALRRELSIHLHGTVQSDLAIAVVRLQQAVGDGDDAGARQALSRARTVLQVGTDLGFPSGIDDIRAYLGQLAASWRGICDIDFNVVGEPDDARQGTTIGRIVTEAVKDAVRHGGADHVDVRITINDGVCDIAVTNNGQAVNGQATDPAPTGLGTRMLSEASPGDWQRTADPDGRTRLSATLRPVPPSAADR